MNGDQILQALTVSFEYPVVFTEEVFHPGNATLVDAMDRLHEGRAHRALAIVDANVAEAQPALADELRSYFHAHAPRVELAGPALILPGGEGIKNDLSYVRQMVSAMVEARLCRHSFVIAVGGGALLDAAGFAAALFHRGLRLIRLPTTVLAQNDAGIGVKNGVNLGNIKNAIGVFAPPFAVINDGRFLLTLPDREWISGIAEAFKVAIIRDKSFFESLAKDAARLRARDSAAMRLLIRRCAGLHLAHTRAGGDPFESSRARPLDFGHWSAHKLEAMSGFAILHGEAVAAGILLDCAYAAIQGWLSGDEFQAIHGAVAATGLPVWFDLLERPELLEGIEEFREHLGGGLCITFPRGIGAGFETGDIDLHAMREAVRQLRAAAGAAGASPGSGRDQR